MKSDALTFAIAQTLLALWLFAFSAIVLLFDGRSGPLLAGITVLIMVVFVFLPPGLLRKTPQRAALVGFLVWLAAIASVEILLPPRCSTTLAQQNGALLTAQLDAYHRQHGHYPATLASAGIHSPIYRCGPFEYQVEKDGHCCLSIGNYNLDGFEATWSSQTREWHTDS